MRLIIFLEIFVCSFYSFADLLPVRKLNQVCHKTWSVLYLGSSKPLTVEDTFTRAAGSMAASIYHTNSRDPIWILAPNEVDKYVQVDRRVQNEIHQELSTPKYVCEAENSKQLGLKFGELIMGQHETSTPVTDVRSLYSDLADKPAIRFSTHAKSGQVIDGILNEIKEVKKSCGDKAQLLVQIGVFTHGTNIRNDGKGQACDFGTGDKAKPRISAVDLSDAYLRPFLGSGVKILGITDACFAGCLSDVFAAQAANADACFLSSSVNDETTYLADDLVPDTFEQIFPKYYQATLNPLQAMKCTALVERWNHSVIGAGSYGGENSKLAAKRLAQIKTSCQGTLKWNPESTAGAMRISDRRWSELFICKSFMQDFAHVHPGFEKQVRVIQKFNFHPGYQLLSETSANPTKYKSCDFNLKDYR